MTQETKEEIRAFRNENWSEKLTEISTNINKLKNDIIIPAIQGSNGLAITTSEKAETFADSLETQFQDNNMNNDIQWENTVQQNVQQINNEIDETTVEEITDILRFLSNKKAPGPDKITVSCLKRLPQTYKQTLTNITNAILQLQHFPNRWKAAHIFALPKPHKTKTHHKKITDQSAYYPH